MQEIKELNNLLYKYVDEGFFPGIQWQININNEQLPSRASFLDPTANQDHVFLSGADLDSIFFD